MSESEKKEAAPSAQNPTDQIEAVARDEFLEAVKKGGDEGLKKAFHVLSKGAPTARVDGVDLQRAVATRGGRELPLENVNETILQVSKEGLFNCEEFVHIIKLLEEPGEADQAKKIREKLNAAGEGKAIILYGEEGVGKTWMAREAAALAVRNGDFDAAIWVYLNRTHDDLSLHESIAYQMSVLAAFEESEAEEARKKKKEKEKAEEVKKKEGEKSGVKDIAEEIKRKREKMEKMIKEAIKGKRLLFILDSQGSRMEANVNDEREKNVEEEVLKKVVLELRAVGGGGGMVKVELKHSKSYKVLITRREGYKAAENEMMVKPFTWDDSKALASRAMGRERIEEVEELGRYFMFRSERLPSQLLLISRIVSYFGKEGLQKLRDDREIVRNGEGVKVLDVLIKGYKKLPKSVLIDCYSPETAAGHFLHQGRKVNFNALICYWIMEGHLGHFDRVEDAYVEGHRVLMELMNCGLLQKQEADYVVASGPTRFHLDIHDYKEFFSGIRPGLAVTFDMRLGRVALADGMIKTVGKGKEIISALLLDGNRISEEESPAESLSKHKDQVEVLAISEPTSQHFELPIFEMRKLRLLALKGCQFLDNLEHFLWKKSDQANPDPSLRPMAAERMESLTVLEISGPSFFKTIPDHLFSLMPNLKTVNMSNLLKVELLPNSFYALTQIEFLILRGCESLKELKSLKNFKDLKVLDISNATSFEKFEDKSLHSNTRLQILNLSNTKLKTLPLINQLKELKFVWLRDCAVLPRIRKIDKMGSLQILDIAGAVEVERFCDPSLEDLGNLVIVDISRTSIKRLPANIGDPTYLYANNCSKIRVVPPVEGLQKLQVLHFSGCDRLREIRQEFFAKVKGLRELDLSKTRVNNLPFLSSLVSLRRLLLSQCESLEKLEKLSSLIELEFLDLSGCKALMELEDGSFDKMIRLQHLDLSGTGLGGQQKPLPSLSELKSLKELHVRDCANLTELPGVEEVPSLEVLDCSGTVLESLPEFSSRDHQTRVIGAGVKSIDTTQLFENLGAARQSDDQCAKWDFKYGEVSLCKWSISNWRVEAANKLGTPVYGVHFLRLLKEYPSFLAENLSAFRFLVYPSESTLPDDFKASYIDELSLRDVYFEQVCEEKMERCLEIRGFDKLPTSLKPLITRAQFVVLVDDPFLKSLLDLGIDTTMAMKACWIESCNELEHVVVVPEKDKEAEKAGEEVKSGGEERRNVAAAKLGELVKGEGDQHKKAIAGKVGESTKSAEAAKSQGDQQKNADAEKSGEATKSEGGEQKNADAEKSGEQAKSEGDQQKNVAAESSGEPTKSEGDEQKDATTAEKSGEAGKSGGDQQKNATSADLKSGEAGESGGDQQKNATSADLKSGESGKSDGDQKKNATTTEKPKESSRSEGDEQKNVGTDKSQEPGKTEGGSELKNPAEDLNNLETLWISDVSNLKSILKGDIQSISFKLLKSLYLEYCPNLSAITSSSSQLQTLETLYIKYCRKLSGLFADDDSPKLDKLRNLQLWGLDSLEKISCKAPLMKKLRVGQCPLLEHVIASRLMEEDKDTITTRHENEGHENLEVLHIKSCDNLKSIFESSQEDVQLERLTHLELSGLPKLQKVARAVPALRVLRVGDCPSLESIVVGGDGVPDLETLEVRSCERMRTIIHGGESKLVNIKNIELLGLPELESLGAELLREVEGEVWACPKLEQLRLIPRIK